MFIMSINIFIFQQKFTSEFGINLERLIHKVSITFAHLAGIKEMHLLDIQKFADKGIMEDGLFFTRSEFNAKASLRQSAGLCEWTD